MVYLSAVANFGLGNRVTALNHIDEAIRMEPNNFTYVQVRQQIAGASGLHPAQPRLWRAHRRRQHLRRPCLAQLRCRWGWCCV